MKSRLDAFYQDGGKVQLLDHHKTALHFNDYEWGHVQVEDDEGKLTSATSLFYEYLVDTSTHGTIRRYRRICRARQAV